MLSALIFKSLKTKIKRLTLIAKNEKIHSSALRAARAGADGDGADTSQRR